MSCFYDLLVVVLIGVTVSSQSADDSESSLPVTYMIPDQNVTIQSYQGYIVSHTGYPLSLYPSASTSTAVINNLNQNSTYELSIRFEEVFDIRPHVIYTYTEYSVVGSSFVYEAEPFGCSTEGDYVAVLGERFSSCNYEITGDTRPQLGQEVVKMVSPLASSLHFIFHTNGDSEVGLGFKLKYELKALPTPTEADSKVSQLTTTQESESFEFTSTTEGTGSSWGDTKQSSGVTQRRITDSTSASKTTADSRVVTDANLAENTSGHDIKASNTALVGGITGAVLTTALVIVVVIAVVIYKRKNKQCVEVTYPNDFPSKEFRSKELRSEDLRSEGSACHTYESIDGMSNYYTTTSSVDALHDTDIAVGIHGHMTTFTGQP